MTAALTGSTGWSGANPLQLGGPPLISTFGRPLPTSATPLLAHAYLNDGVTPTAANATFSVLGTGPLHVKTTNGGPPPLTLQVAAPVAGLAQGNVVRLSEQGSPFAGFVYGGVAESFPDTVSPSGTRHEIQLSPFAAELTRVYSQAVYTLPTDLSQVVREAVALTQHCSCDQVSVPATTGIQIASSGQVDFRNQTLQQVLDVCRGTAGATWYWYCDELGRVWFQPMGSAAVYTVPQAQYKERTSNGGDIQYRLNDILVVGGIPPMGSANAFARFSSLSSQANFGVRSLTPPLSLPNVTDQFTLNLIAANLGVMLDRVWNRLQVKIPAGGATSFRQRIHGSQPGGAMLRTWEPTQTPFPESAAGSGYAGPHIVQEITYDGAYQDVTAGDMPVASQSDIDHMVNSLVARQAAVAVSVPLMPLNQPVTLAAQGSISVATGTLYDSSGVLSNQVLGDLFGGSIAQNPGQNIAGAGASVWSLTTPAIQGTFSLSRQVHCLFLFFVMAKSSGAGGVQSYARLNLLTGGVSVATTGGLKFDKGAGGIVASSAFLYTGAGTVAAIGPALGRVPITYTLQIEVAGDVGQTMFFDTGAFEGWGFGT